MPPLPAQPSGPAPLRPHGATLKFTVTVNLGGAGALPQPTVTPVELIPAPVTASTSATSPDPSPNSPDLTDLALLTHLTSLPAHCLYKGHHIWLLCFGGLPAFLKDETALAYVAWHLTHPNQPIHGLDLCARSHPANPKALALNELTNPHTGLTFPLDASARLQEANLPANSSANIRALRREFADLRATLDSPTASAAEKAEATARMEELGHIAAVCATTAHSGADRSVRAVRRALQRFHAALQLATNEQAQPHPVLRPFAQHLQQYLLLPSAHRAAPVGHFIYQPPPSIHWNR